MLYITLTKIYYYMVINYLNYIHTIINSIFHLYRPILG